MSPLAAGALRRFTAEDVDALAAGATLLGSGGGGAVDVGAQLLRHLLKERSVELVPAAALPRGALVVHVGLVGGPDVLAERLIHPRDLALATEAVVEHLGGRLDAAGVIEIGGINGLIGVLAAAQLGVPLVDGDLMGRAFPSINKTTLAVAGHQATPLAMVSPAGDTVVVPVSSARMAEALVAATAGAMGGAAVLALYPCSAQVLETVGVRGSVSACLALGEAYLDPATTATTPLVDRLGGTLILEGRVDEIRPRVGPQPGSMTLTDHGTGSTARIDYLDEFLAVTRDGITVAATPDVIVALDPSNRAPLRADQVRLGQPLVLFSLPALHSWPDAASRVVGPAAFGLDLEPGS